MSESNQNARMPKQSAFLAQHNFTAAEFARTGLQWDVLEALFREYSACAADLRSIGDYVRQLLQGATAVHSLKVRVKDPEHLVAKIIRKRLERPQDEPIDSGNYQQKVTDLVGLRVLHLFKHEWESIHAFILEKWELFETPTAYFREGDPKELLEQFRAAGCDPKVHPAGYRSVHYVIKSSATRQTHLVELQVRTIFEEGWSEIDHRVRYPRHSSHEQLTEFLTIFNRLAGSADEMGTFIRALSKLIEDQEVKAQESAAREKALEETLSKLKITAAERDALSTQIDEFKKSYAVVGSISATLTPPRARVIGHVTPGDVRLVPAHAAHLQPGVVVSAGASLEGAVVVSNAWRDGKCTRCGASMSIPPGQLVVSQTCSTCAAKP